MQRGAVNVFRRVGQVPALNGYLHQPDAGRFGSLAPHGRNHLARGLGRHGFAVIHDQRPMITARAAGVYSLWAIAWETALWLNSSAMILATRAGFASA